MSLPLQLVLELLALCSRMSEGGLIPKEKLIAKQRVFQSLKGPVHLRGPSDKITSVAIPLAMTVTSVVLIVSFLSTY